MFYSIRGRDVRELVCGPDWYAELEPIWTSQYHLLNVCPHHASPFPHSRWPEPAKITVCYICIVMGRWAGSGDMTIHPPRNPSHHPHIDLTICVQFWPITPVVYARDLCDSLASHVLVWRSAWTARDQHVPVFWLVKTSELKLDML